MDGIWVIYAIYVGSSVASHRSETSPAKDETPPQQPEPAPAPQVEAPVEGGRLVFLTSPDRGIDPGVPLVVAIVDAHGKELREHDIDVTLYVWTADDCGVRAPTAVELTARTVSGRAEFTDLPKIAGPLCLALESEKQLAAPAPTRASTYLPPALDVRLPGDASFPAGGAVEVTITPRRLWPDATIPAADVPLVIATDAACAGAAVTTGVTVTVTATATRSACRPRHRRS